jgi:IS4 transposase
MSLKSESCDIGKDTFYRFVNSCHINWFKFTSMLSALIINNLISKATDEDRVNVFIVDDTVYSRGRSKKVELLSWVRDHARHVSVRGFRLLTLGWSDGNSFLPVNGCLLASTTKRCNENAYAVDKRTCGYRQRQRAQSKAPEVMLQMLQQALKSGIRASYVLFDSWFSSPKTVMSVTEENLDVIAMLKKTSKAHYRYKGEMLPVTEIYKRNKKRRGRSKYLLSAEIEMDDKNHCKSVPARLVFVRNKNRKKEYLVLISTDKSLPEEEVIRLYGKRWSIEVFFKVCKSYLKLTGECRSLSYDAMTAYIAIVFARYMMLSVENRMQIDERTLGELFYDVSDELPDITWIEAFRILMEQLVITVTGKFFLANEELDALLEDFMSKLPEILKYKVQKCT